MSKLHSEDFKRDAVRMALSSGLTRKQLASDLGVGFSTLNAWVRKYRAEVEGSPLPLHNGAVADAAELAKENERLRIENRHLKEEREILKKATQFFAEISK